MPGGSRSAGKCFFMADSVDLLFVDRVSAEGRKVDVRFFVNGDSAKDTIINIPLVLIHEDNLRFDLLFSRIF